MVSIYDATKVPNVFLKLSKVTIFNVRKPKRQPSLDIDFLLNRLKANAIEYVIYESINSFLSEYESIREYTSDLLFLSDAPKTMDEINVIDRIRPERVHWISYPNFGITTCSYIHHKPTIDDGLELPFSPFSSALERFFLYNLAKNVKAEGAVLEIGAYSGGTSLALGEGNKRSSFKSKIFSVDRFFQESYRDFLAEADILDDFIITECPSQYFSKSAKDVFLNNIRTTNMRLIWIDGDHTYEGCVEDLKNYKDYLVDGGVIAVHDYGTDLRKHGGISKAVYEELICDSRFSNFAVVGSIFYAEKKSGRFFLNISEFQEQTASTANNPKACVQFLSRMGKFTDKKTLIYGAGRHTEAMLTEMFSEYRDIFNSVVCIVDDNCIGEGILNSKKIMHPDTVSMDGFDYIIISSFDYEKEIAEKIALKNTGTGKLISFYNNPAYISIQRQSVPVITSQDKLKIIFEN